MLEAAAHDQSLQLTELPCVQVKDLCQAQTCVTEQRQTCTDSKAELSATQDELSIMRSTHLNATDNAKKQISQLEDELQAARLHVNMTESNLKDSCAKQASAEASIQSLTADIEYLQKQMHAGTEQNSAVAFDLQARTAAYDELTAEHHSIVDKCQLLSTSLQKSEEQLQARSLELEQAIAAMESERIIKVRLPDGHQQHLNEFSVLPGSCLVRNMQQDGLY